MKYIVVVIGLVVTAFVFGNFLTSSSTANKPQVQGVSQEINSLPVAQFQQLFSTGNYTLLDIRTQEEYLAGHLPKSQQVDFYQTDSFSKFLDNLDKQAKYLIYCRSGNRSAKALTIMQAKGFTSVSDLSGGYNAWVNLNLPIESP